VEYRKKEETSMFAFLGAMLAIVGKFLGIILVINIFMLFIKGGKDMIVQLRDTTLMAVKLGLDKTQRFLWKHYNKEEKKEPN
jgi:hypothetical protein